MVEECEMSGRRSSNPRWSAWGIAVTICSLASAGVGLAPAHATAASSTISAVEAPRMGSALSPSAAASQSRGDKIRNKGPRFMIQPRLVGRNLFFVVKVNPYRTAGKHRSAKLDLLSGHVDVSRRGTAIRTVGLNPKSRAKKLIFTAQLKTRFVRRAGRIQYQIRLPLAVARSLAQTSVRYRNARVRVVLVHRKDTDRRLRVRQTLVLAQSSLERLPTARSRAATDRLRTAPRSENVDLYGFLSNNTPFTLQMSVQPTQCVDMTQWTGTLSSGQQLWDPNSVILYSGSSNGLSTWQNLSHEAVSALNQAAVQAGQIAIDFGAASFTPEGAASDGLTFGLDFVSHFITDALWNKTCADTPATWVISAVATGLPLPLWQGPLWQGETEPWTWAVGSDGNPATSVPVQTPAQLASTLGAQTSVQWNWNGGSIAANGAGASFFSGGLLQATKHDVNDGYQTTIFYQNNAEITYGPIQTSNIQMTAITGTDPSENTPGVNLACNTGNWELLSPWGGYSYSLSSPPNSSASGHLVTSFYYNGVDGSGNPMTGQPIPYVPAIESDYSPNVPLQQWVDQTTIKSIIQNNGGGTITSWGCSIQAQTEVPAFVEPPGWPSSSGTSNLGWYSTPLNATAPNPL